MWSGSTELFIQFGLSGVGDFNLLPEAKAGKNFVLCIFGTFCDNRKGEIRKYRLLLFDVVDEFKYVSCSMCMPS